MLYIFLSILLVVFAGVIVFNVIWPLIDAERRQLFISNSLRKNKNIHNMVLSVKTLSGEERISASKGGLDEDSEFAVASISKLYTHTLIFQLIDKKSIGYETKLGEVLSGDDIEGLYVRDGIDKSKDLTIRQLIDQTSGLADYETDRLPDDRIIMDEVMKLDFPITFRDALGLNKKLTPLSEPGAKAHYANINALLLGRVVEVIEGKSLEEVYAENIFRPLRLQDTRVAAYDDSYASIYNGSDAIERPQYIASGLAAGGIVSTNRDLSVFIRAFFRNELFDAKHISGPVFKNIQFPMVKYGSGMMSIRVPRLMSPFFPAPQIIGHSGSTGSFAYYCPSKDLVVTGTVNQIKSRPYQYIYLYLSTL